MEKMNSLMRLAFQKRYVQRINFTSCLALRSYSDAVKNEATTTKSGETTSHISGSVPVIKHRPSAFDKRLLVWTKKYKTLADVPDTVPRETMDRAKNKTRIWVTMYMMVATTVISFVMIQWGRYDASKGESVHKMNLDWHKAYDEEHKK